MKKYDLINKCIPWKRSHRWLLGIQKRRIVMVLNYVVVFIVYMDDWTSQSMSELEIETKIEKRKVT
jgi:hypothetical protein